MDCPACHKRMEPQDFGGAIVDVCAGCHGIWFDQLELKKLDEKHEGVGKAVAEALVSTRQKDANRGRIKCPKCGILMAAHFYQSNTMVTVDECYGCAGFFLDSGELKVVRAHFLTEKEREEYLTTLLGQKVGDVANRTAAVQKVVGILGSHFKK